MRSCTCPMSVCVCECVCVRFSALCRTCANLFFILFQPVWFPLCHSLYVCIVSGFQAQLNWLIKIRACSACPVFPQYRILSLFSSLPLSKARERVRVFARVSLCVRVCPYHIIGLDIKASYLQRVSQGFSGNLERT